MDGKRAAEAAETLLDRREQRLEALVSPKSLIKTHDPRRQHHTRYMQTDQDDESEEETETKEPSGGQRSLPQFQQGLSFSYKGDVFAQRGVYSEASMYLSRLPPNRKASTIRQHHGAKYKTQVRLTPVQQVSDEPNTSKQEKMARKRQYALSVEAMAANPLLHSSLLNDNIIPTLMTLCRTKDIVTLGACISTLCHLSHESVGREAILSHSSLSLLSNLVGSVSLDKRLLTNALATLANLTIEDTFESVFVKEKGLESIMKHRKSSELTEAMCTFTLFNLTCPAYSYPRVDDVIRAIVDHSRECRDKATLSRAVFNLSCIKMNQGKLADPDSIAMLRALVRNQNLEEVRVHALATIYHLTDTVASRRAILRYDCVGVLVDGLQHFSSEEQVKCSIAVLTKLMIEPAARETLGKPNTLDILVALLERMQRIDCVSAIYQLLAVILSAPGNVSAVQAGFFHFLLQFNHEEQLSTTPSVSRFVLFCLASIFAWSENDESASTSAIVGAQPTLTYSATTAGSTQLEALLNDPSHFNQAYQHVAVAIFPEDSGEVYLQVLLLYNLSLRYPKLDVARLAIDRLKQLGLECNDERILSLLCGILFSLCQEYDAHEILFRDGILEIMHRITKTVKEDDPNTLCLQVICIVFDAKQLSRDKYVEIVEIMFPVLVTMCSSGSGALHASCAACLARFAMIEESRLMMVQNGLIDALSSLAGEEDPQTLRLCVHAYSCLSRDPLICSNLINNGIVKSLTYLAAAPEEAVRRACAVTFCNLSTAEENVNLLVKQGALRALLVISCVKSNDPETRRICMRAIMNLLRNPTNIDLMCNEGLMWAFTLFVSSMEPRDYDTIAEAFCALTYYEATWKGLLKPTLLSAMFQMFSPTIPTSVKAKVLRGVCNLLTDPIPNAVELICADITRFVRELLVSKESDQETRSLAAQILVITLQASPSIVESFVEDDMIRALEFFVDAAPEPCLKYVAMLIQLLSVPSRARLKLVTDKIVRVILQLMVKTRGDTPLQMLRTIYNITCSPDLIPIVCTAEAVSAIARVLHQYAATNVDTVKLSAAILRNFSSDPTCHTALTSDSTIELLKEIFKNEDVKCKEDVSVCICNVFLGKINSTALLTPSILPLILWISTASVAGNAPICSAVLRKLSIPPGNAQIMVDGGTISHLVTLVQTSPSIYVKRNCVATFCLLSRKSGIPAVLASYGVISVVMELLENLKKQEAMDKLFEVMCVDLLSTLAEFAQANVPQECKLSSMLYHLIENDERPDSGTSDVLTWQSDRRFLLREENGLLPPTKISTMYLRSLKDIKILTCTRFPIAFAGYAVDFNQSTSHLDVRTIEPLSPSLQALLAANDPQSLVRKHTEGPEQQEQSQVSAFIQLITKDTSFELITPQIYPKLRAPYLPLPSSISSSSTLFLEAPKISTSPTHSPVKGSSLKGL